jgi:hypothetical protein
MAIKIHPITDTSLSTKLADSLFWDEVDLWLEMTEEKKREKFA